jgi:hypothetical protein
VRVNAPPGSAGIGNTVEQKHQMAPDHTANHASAGATAKCNDGTYSHSPDLKIQCGDHQGVAMKMSTGNNPGPPETMAPSHSPNSSSTKLVPPASAPVLHPPSPNSPPGVKPPNPNSPPVLHPPNPNSPPTAPASGGIGNTTEMKFNPPPDATVNNQAAGATAKCKDGTYSHSHDTKIMCSDHKGVGQKIAAPPQN